MKSAGDDPALNALAGQLISLLSAPAREELMLACSTPAGVALSALSDDTLLQLERYLPRLIKTDQRRRLRLEWWGLTILGQLALILQVPF